MVRFSHSRELGPQLVSASRGNVRQIHRRQSGNQTRRKVLCNKLPAAHVCWAARISDVGLNSNQTPAQQWRRALHRARPRLHMQPHMKRPRTAIHTSITPHERSLHTSNHSSPCTKLCWHPPHAFCPGSNPRQHTTNPPSTVWRHSPGHYEALLAVALPLGLCVFAIHLVAITLLIRSSHLVMLLCALLHRVNVNVRL